MSYQSQRQVTVGAVLSKVPEVTIFFWVIKILATTIGETAADYLGQSWVRVDGHHGGHERVARRGAGVPVPGAAVCAVGLLAGRGRIEHRGYAGDRQSH